MFERSTCIVLSCLSLLLLPARVGATDSRQVISLDNDQWKIATDPDNLGQTGNWWAQPQPGAKPTRVPWIIQDPFPGYHGLAWYWRSFDVPVHPNPQGRYLLHFEAVMYKADVYLNDMYVGSHENGETPFALDVTEAVRPQQTNRLAVRVLDPREDSRIDGMLRRETPRRYADRVKQHGGIEGSVELRLVPAAYLTDLYVIPDHKTGAIQIQAQLHNGTTRTLNGRVTFDVRLEGDSGLIDTVTVDESLPAGATEVKAGLKVPNPLLWELDRPTLYRVTAHMATKEFPSSSDTDSTRLGFREFKFERGYFRLNGWRIYLRCAHTANHSPIGLWVPDDVGTSPDLLQRRMQLAKQMGFNMIRYLGGIPRRNVVDWCDEIGLMLYVETLAGWQLENSPYMKERFDRAIREALVRDRNHPSITAWGLLNETGAGAAVYQHAKMQLPLVRRYDNTRLVFLNSARLDNEFGLGSASNPGSTQWDVYLGGEGPGGGKARGDVHVYLGVPHSAGQITHLRTVGQGLREHSFLSEYGIGSGQHLPRVMALFEQQGKTHMGLYQYFSAMYKSFLDDWERWQMGELYDKPSDFFDECLAAMAPRRLQGLNAIRSNPYLAGHSLTSFADIPNSGEGVVTCAGEIKLGALIAMRDAWAPLRFCLFAEPYHVYRGDRIRLEAVLANEDALSPGQYEVQLNVLNSGGGKVWATTAPVAIAGGEPPFAQSFFTRDVVADWPTGQYHLTASFVEGGVAAQGREVVFFVTDDKEMPAVPEPVVVWGEDPVLTDWMKREGISAKVFEPNNSSQRELILVGKTPRQGNRVAEFKELCRHIGRGAGVVFLDHRVFANGKDTTAWAPLSSKGSIGNTPDDVYIRDQWIKDHPLFARMPNKGPMDHVYYRHLLGNFYWSNAEKPVAAVAGDVYTCWVHAGAYKSGLHVAVYELGAGRFILNTLDVGGNLGRDPAAELLLRNMLSFAGREVSKPTVPLPSHFEELLDKMYGSTAIP